MTNNPVSVVLNESEWGQIIDGLRCRAEIYEGTVRYYETGYAESEIAEVRDAKEARELSNLYRAIIFKIEKDLAAKRTY